MIRSKGRWSLLAGAAVCLSLIACCRFHFPNFRSDRSFYVSPTGHDGNSGTINRPWRTIQRGVDELEPGDSLYVRGGVYREVVNIERSGRPDAPLKVQAYPGETPIIDGNDYSLPPGDWGVLFAVRGQHVAASGFEVRRSNWMGVLVSGRSSRISGFNSHHNNENGILATGDDTVVEDSRVWQNCFSNADGRNSRDGWSSGLSAARHPRNAVIRRNTVYLNWGEGLSTYEAEGTLIEGNVVHDNYTNVYVSDAAHITIRGNLIYQTPHGAMTQGARVGIMMGDEQYKPQSSDIMIVNNFLRGNHQNIYWWQGSGGGGMQNVLIAYNTLVDSFEDPGVVMHRGPHQGVRICNNIVVQDNEQPLIALYSLPGISVEHNLWSKQPPAYALTSGDIVGDPRLTRGTDLTAGWFRLLPSSPAIGRAIPLPEVTDDYFGTPRDAAPDIGGHEFVEPPQGRPLVPRSS